jgi:hypothetical protein
VSGGSYEYLYMAEWTRWEEQLRKMRDRLYELGYPEASDETARYLSTLEELNGNERLRAAWHAVEWMDSGDTGIDQTHDAMAKNGWRYAAA